MINYFLRRIAYAIPILFGVNLITFLLFFVVNTPDDMARLHLGDRHLTEQSIAIWKTEHGYNKPVLFNAESPGLDKFTDTIFFDKSLRLFAFDFGRSDAGRPILADISQRMWPSLAIALPTFIIGLLTNISVALLVLLFRASRLETFVMVSAVILMSISGLFYIIGGQYLISKIWQWLPISGYVPGEHLWRFILLPTLIGIVAGLGIGIRWYRSLFLEELHKDYARSARARGISEIGILFKHILQNAMIPILTGVVVVIPTLFMGSLIMEAFFAIPGLGSYTVDAIQSQDFAIVRSMVYLGAFLYILGLIMTDLAYAWVDPRVRLN